jgi:redox-sensitive bicupin YhaK (pirin superfamily)
MCAAEVLTQRVVAHVMPMPWHSFGGESGAYMLRADAAQISPFIGIDAFTMAQPVFGPHPHAGMSAVTVLLPESPSSVINRDSLGDRSRIEPGDIHWTQAGRGMQHEEVPAVPGQATLGLQVFVNLAAAHKQADPVAFKVRAADMPHVRFHEGSLRVVAGRFADLDGTEHVSPLALDKRWLTPGQIWDLTLNPHAQVVLPVARGHNAFAVVHAGLAQVGERSVPAQHAVLFERQGDVLNLQAGAQGLRAVIFSGAPIDEPLVAKGPFVGNTLHDLAAYAQAFQRGQMGQLSATY